MRNVSESFLRRGKYIDTFLKIIGSLCDVAAYKLVNINIPYLVQKSGAGIYEILKQKFVLESVDILIFLISIVLRFTLSKRYSKNCALSTAQLQRYSRLFLYLLIVTNFVIIIHLFSHRTGCYCIPLLF